MNKNYNAHSDRTRNRSERSDYGMSRQSNRGMREGRDSESYGDYNHSYENRDFGRGSRSDRDEYSLDEGRITMGRPQNDWGKGSEGQRERFGEQSPSNWNRFGSSTSTHFGKGPRGYKRSDERIKEEVCDALYRDADVDASEIDVEVESGEVTLSGTVGSRHEKRMAEDALENISGIENVSNQLRISNSSSMQPKGLNTELGKKGNLSARTGGKRSA